jgi:RND family efflux transporter MFP subunit
VRRRTLPALALALALACGLAAGCHRTEEQAPDQRRRVRCAPVTPMTVSDTIEVRGTIAPPPDRDALVSAQVAGRVLAVPVREGDAVQAGQVLARLDDGPARDELHGAEAMLAKARAEVANADATANRARRVFEHGIAARQEVDDAVTRARAARAAESEAEATARRARRQVDRAVVRSPLSGVVVRLLRRPGELVDGTPATPILEVADPARLELLADATAADLVQARKGQAAEIAVTALPRDRWAGHVVAVSPAVDRATGLGSIRVALEGAPRPPIGVLGTARIVVGAARASVGVPSAALRTGAGGELEVALCGPDGLAHLQRVARGPSAGGRTETPGLRAGQAVVVDPVVGIADGEPIDVESPR